MKVELITWIDSHTDMGWKKAEEKTELQKCYSVGVIDFEDEEVITLGGSWDLDEDGHLQDTNNRMTIPVRCVLERKTIYES